MKLKYCLTYIFFLLNLMVNAQSTEVRKSSKVERVSQTYGFLLGQELTLKKIEVKYPSLKSDVLLARMTFDLSFSKARKGIENYLENYYGGPEKMDILRNETYKIIDATNSHDFDEKMADNFLQQVHTRAMGNIPTPYLETLLSFQYAEDPVGEFVAGYTKTYKTKGHEKSKNTDWQLKIPMSWSWAEGNGPNVIQYFKSDYGSGAQGMLIMVKPLGVHYTKADIEEFYTEEGAKMMLEDGQNLISFSEVTLCGQRGGVLEIEQVLKRLDLDIKMRLLLFTFIYEDNLYFFQGSVSSTDLSEDLAKTLQKFRPLYMQVASSIMLNDLFK